MRDPGNEVASQAGLVLLTLLPSWEILHLFLNLSPQYCVGESQANVFEHFYPINAHQRTFHAFFAAKKWPVSCLARAIRNSFWRHFGWCVDSCSSAKGMGSYTIRLACNLVIFIHTTHMLHQFTTGIFSMVPSMVCSSPWQVALQGFGCRCQVHGLLIISCPSMLKPTLDPSFFSPHSLFSFFWLLLCHRGMQGTLSSLIAKSRNWVLCWVTIPQ